MLNPISRIIAAFRRTHTIPAGDYPSAVLARALYLTYGTVTQITSRATGVTLNRFSGQITTYTSSLATSDHADFTVTNSHVGANDVVVANITKGGTGSPRVSVVGVSAGSFILRVTNDDASTADTSADVINFAILPHVA